jgi:acyl transferase domain-containing protein/acyl carrier protein
MAESSTPSGRPEPIAILGIGCRLPGGADSPEAFWDLLQAGRDAIIDVPPGRWDLRQFHDRDSDVPAKSHARQGGFLREPVDTFDPAFFGFTPREAEELDPMQRLLLETTWEAMERAGQDMHRLKGSPTAVFIGGFCTDSLLQRLGVESRHLIDAYTATSVTLTMLANRISHAFDFRGPSASVDTACSSSLVAVHLACSSLWRGEARLAVAGGANVMLRPEYSIAMSKGGFLSPHSRCMAFDHRADGYVRGEGAAVVVLKPLSAALADGDPVQAVIRATGMNQDGRTPGITQPSPEAQERLMREVYARAGVRPSRVAYVEAHGTGTQAGDPAEAASLNAVLGGGRPPGAPCWVGSVKTNIGHLEATAGIAGLIKATLVLRHRQIPPNLHYQRPNPKIDFARSGLRVPTALTPLNPADDGCFVAVNSFGYGGTNAHVLLEAAPGASPSTPAADQRGELALFPLSAADPVALRTLAGSVADALAGTAGGADWRDWLYTAAFRRTHLAHRMVAIADSPATAAERLRNFSRGEPDDGVISGGRAPDSRLVFVFTGMGPQTWGMASGAYESESVFRDAYDAVADLFASRFALDLRAVFHGDAPGAPISDPVTAQCANFAVQVALVALWRHWGVTPDAVVGHSTGEIAAAHVAGALALDAAVAVCFHRSRRQKELEGSGGMLALGATEENVRECIADEPEVVIAAVNAPEAITLAGPLDALDRVAASLPSTTFQRRLKVTIPYHGRAMLGIADALAAELAFVRPAAPTIPLYSTVTGVRMRAEETVDAAYWVRNVTHPVEFAAACRALFADGHRSFLEVGPHPVLADSLHQNLAAAGLTGTVAASLRRQVSDAQQLRRTLATLHASGHAIAWSAVAPVTGRCVRFPAYPWQRQKLWLESERCRTDRLGSRRHSFVNRRAVAPRPTWEVEVNPAHFPYLADHRLGSAIVFPGAAYLEAMLVLHREVFGTEPCVIEDLAFERMLVVDPKRPPLLAIEHDPEQRTVRIYSRSDPEQPAWTAHAAGRLHHLVEPPPERRRSSPRGAPTASLPAGEIYRQLETRGLRYGPWFRTIRSVIRTGDEATVHVRGLPGLAGVRDDIAHPTLVDGVFQALIALIPKDDGQAMYVPSRIGRVRCHAPLQRNAVAHLRVAAAAPGRLLADAIVMDPTGRVALELTGIELRAVANASRARDHDALYTPAWQPTSSPGPARNPGACAIVGAAPAWRDRLRARLTSDGWTVADDLASLAPGGLLLVLGEATRSPDFDAVLAGNAALISILQSAVTRPDWRIILVQPGAAIVTGRESEVSFTQFAWPGIAPVVMNEGLAQACRIVDVDFAAEETVEQLALEALADDDAREVAWRAGQRFRRELRRVADAPHPQVAISPRATYVVTGGTRGFGLAVARWLASQGAGRVILVSRTGRATPGLPSVIATLGPTQVEVVSADVSDEPAMRALLTELAAHALPLRGVFHGAMVLDDRFFRDQTAEQLARVFRPKVGGALVLHRLTQEVPLDLFVCFSSVSALLGNPGQAAYAGANAFLDGLAHYRRRHGLPALSVNLGLLADTGVAAGDSGMRQTLDALGVAAISNAEAFAGITAGLVQRHVQLGVFRVDWAKWAQVFPAGARDQRFEPILGASASGGTGAHDFRRRLEGLTPDEQVSAIVASLRSHLAMTLRVPVSSLGEGETLGRIGVDSLAMVELVATVNREFAVQLSPADLLRQPSLQELARLVLERIVRPRDSER